jgi:hypothetical protein
MKQVTDAAYSSHGSDRMGRGDLLAAYSSHGSNGKDLVENPISLPWTLLHEKTKLPFHHSKYSGTTSWANLYLEVPLIFYRPISLIEWLRFGTRQYRWYLLNGSKTLRRNILCKYVKQ